MCNNNINAQWSNESRVDDMADMHLWIAKNNSHIKGFKALIYSGDNDAICSTLGTQSWIEPTFIENKERDWFSWTYESGDFGTQVGGYGVD
mmetsp:Transcript_44651/g.37552  ORF Transcript_44651/g.37552 Transcript_44651/m.37552 type:complete len:91 (+) Transcript_44651:1007-1279(+)